jgi:hypothetical protein
MRTHRPCKSLLPFALAAASLLLPATATAMRCGTALISKGDIRAKVLKYCGEPTQTSEHYGLRQGFYVRSGVTLRTTNGTVSRGQHYYPYGQIEVLVEDWIFNLGPNRLMRHITFENGIVVEVETLDYGYTDF